MHMIYRTLMIMSLGLVIAACSGDGAENNLRPTDVPTENSEESSETSDAEETSSPEWLNLELTDVNTGEVFTLASLEGQTVFVETMATWCSNCRIQLNNVRTARGEIEDRDIVFIALSLETNLSNEELADYTRNEGFDWTFAVMSPDMLRSLVNTFGRSVSSAPSTPHFIIHPDGTFTDVVNGIDSPERLIALFDEIGGA